MLFHQPQWNKYHVLLTVADLGVPCLWKAANSIAHGVGSLDHLDLTKLGLKCRKIWLLVPIFSTEHKVPPPFACALSEDKSPEQTIAMLPFVTMLRLYAALVYHIA